MKKTLAMVLAGGKGSRLEPLTSQRAKPAVPFGGKYRIIDFVLSNMINSGISEIVVLSQYQSRSLERHIRDAWTRRAGIGQDIYTLPPTEGQDRGWYRGTACAIQQNIDRIEHSNPDRVAVFGGDHIYMMDVSKMIEAHNGGNDLTIAANRINISEENFEINREGKRRFKFGVIEADKKNRVINFQEKPEHPAEIPGQPGYCWASMGNYLFKTDVLIDVLKRDYGLDFGNHVIPKMKEDGMKLFVFPFDGYWRDVGDIASYYSSNMDLNRDNSGLDLFNPEWPIRTHGSKNPPTRLLINGKISTISEGCNIEGIVENCILSPGVRIGKNSYVQDSIIFGDVNIGDNVRIRRAIIDRFNTLESRSQVGYDSEEDRKKGYSIKSEIVIVPRGKLS